MVTSLGLFKEYIQNRDVDLLIPSKPPNFHPYLPFHLQHISRAVSHVLQVVF